MNAISSIRLMPATKAERETFVAKVVNEVKSGAYNALELELMLKSMEETISAIRKNEDVKDLVLTEAEKYPEKTFTFLGHSITKTSRTTFYFNECGDSQYNRMAAELDELKQKVKDRETFLKGIKPGVEVADTETGEIIQPPVTTTSTFLTIKLK